MKFTDIFITRPILATVVSLVIVLLGIRAGSELSVRQYPLLRNAQVNVQVFYPGADPELMEGFITTPLEREIASADGIDFLYSLTTKGRTVISAFLRPDRDPDQALTEISSKINKVRSQLPAEAEDPIIEVVDAERTLPLYIAFTSDVLDDQQLSDFMSRVVEPEIAGVEGVQQVMFLGQRTFAIRVWLKSDRLAAHGLTPSEVQSALRQQNFISALGETKGSEVKISLNARTDLRTLEEFESLVVKSDQDGLVRLGDLADIELGSENYEQGAFWNGERAIFIAVQVRPDANLLKTIGEVREMWPALTARFPEGIYGEIGYDATNYIQGAIDEVRLTLIEAVLIVVIIIFLFLGSVRSALIPAVTVPVSLIGALFLMYTLGFTINLLTLLAMVLAIGMVVDDAIIVLENIHRHVEEGMKPFDAAIQGARELVGPIIAMTITLIAVYTPIGFLTGLTGTLFTEFAFTLAGAVLISGIVALTLTPMMCSYIIKPMHGTGAEANRLETWLDDKFEALRQSYKRRLHSALQTHHVLGLFGLIVLVSCFFLYKALPQELVPAEDSGFFGMFIESDNFATLEYTEKYMNELHKKVQTIPELEKQFSFTGTFSPDPSSAFIGLKAQRWDERDKPLKALIHEASEVTKDISGLRIATFQPPPLPSPGRGFPVEVVLKSTRNSSELATFGEEFIAAAMKTKKFIFLDAELRINLPTTVIEIDRDKAALLGIDMARVGADLSAALSGAEVNRFSFDSRSYKVIQQVSRDERINPEQLANYYTRTGNGTLIPLSTVVTMRETVMPRSRNHAQQLNANPIIGVQRPGVSLSEALETLEQIAREILPRDVVLDYSGASRQFKQEGSALLLTFAFALIIIYLVLAAQFESFRDPLVILVAVPMSICGALLFITLFGMSNNFGLSDFPGMTMNLYTKVGLLTLVGVISKHGILIVEFANKLQMAGMSKIEAIEEAASIRLRPILMTTAALVVAMVPLLTASGPGASARFSMGLVIAGGMLIGTLFTLYVLPAVYLYIGRDLSPVKDNASSLASNAAV